MSHCRSPCLYRAPALTCRRCGTPSTATPDGNLWFTDMTSSKVGKITTSGTITEYALPASSGPHEIAAGPDGNLWFTDYATSKIGTMW
jgi:streptogramin lyase